MNGIKMVGNCLLKLTCVFNKCYNQFTMIVKLLS